MQDSISGILQFRTRTAHINVYLCLRVMRENCQNSNSSECQMLVGNLQTTRAAKGLMETANPDHNTLKTLASANGMMKRV